MVLIHGSPIAVEYAKANVPAIVDAHYPGAMGGLAIADVLTGVYNPCGRLTTTVYPKDFVKRSKFDTGLRSDGGLTYMHYDGKYGEPLWEFGDGISYSTFDVKAQGRSVTATTAALAAAPISFSVAVTNKAGPAGCFSALGFISSDHPQAPRNRKLFDYTRASLEGGKTEVLTVKLTAAAGALIQADGAAQILPGSYTVTVANVSFDLKLTGSVVTVAAAPPLFKEGSSDDSMIVSLYV